MIRVAVLGSTGMLGHTVARVLATDRRFDVVPFSRRNGPGTHFIDAVDPYLAALRDVDYVVNCIGVVWQAQNPSREETFRVNSVFPWRLQQRCNDIRTRLIHVSTDCVFSGKRGGYTEHDAPDVVNDYGLSKVLGEPKGAMVVRSSVVGREIDTQKSLLEWAVANQGNAVDGYTNHVWNGVTSTEYARICGTVMADDLWAPGVHHVHSTTLNKCDLLRMISDALDLRLNIRPTETPVTVNRTLATVKPLCQQLAIPDIGAMLAALKHDRA